jgi:glycosidase
MFCFVDNHDTATGDEEPRFDRVRPVKAGNAAFVLSFLRRGVPLVFNGNEVADNALNTFYAPVDNVARAYRCVDWGRALQPDGQERLRLIRELSRMRKENVFANGTHEWIADGELKGAIAFVRRTEGRTVFVAANMTAKEMSFKPSGLKLTGTENVLLSDGGALRPDGSCSLKEWGYIVCDVE